MRQLYKLIILLVLLILGAESYGQEDKDTRLWTSIGLEFEPTKNWNFGLEGNYRLKDNISELEEYFGELAIKRKIVKGLWVGAALRYIFENDNIGNVQGIENHLRYQFETTYQFKPGRFALKFRIRYQNKNELGVNDIHTERVRFKSGLSFNVPNWKLDPEISGEIFSGNFNKSDSLFNSYRIKIGTDYSFKNMGKIDIYYALQRDFEILDRETLHIIGLKYSFTFKSNK